VALAASDNDETSEVGPSGFLMEISMCNTGKRTRELRLCHGSCKSSMTECNSPYDRMKNDTLDTNHANTKDIY